MWEMIVGMIYGVLEMQAVMLGFGEVMFTPLRRYVSHHISSKGILSVYYAV